MRRTLWISLCVSFVLAVSMLGCEDVVNITSPGSDGIQVSGTGSVSGEPDVAILSLGVSAERKTVADARETAASAMQGVVDSLLANGVAEEDVQTQQFSIQPMYNYNDGRQELRGYLVSNMLSAKVRDMDHVGQVIDDAAAAGGDVIRVQSIQFTIDDPTEFAAQARVKAMQDAQAKAQLLADEGGITLGKPTFISESVGSTKTVYNDYDRAAAPESETPIETGLLEIRVTVNVVYDID